MFDFAKLLGKLPGFVFAYPDCFLGLCCVVIGLPQAQGVNPSNAFLPFGFALIALSMVRRTMHYIGAVRVDRYEERDKGTLLYPKFFAGLFWSAILRGCV